MIPTVGTKNTLNKKITVASENDATAFFYLFNR